MSAQNAKVRRSADNEDKKSETDAFDLFSRTDLLWWPYRSFSKALLKTHDNLAAFMDVNRKLADEMRDIVRKEQDLVMQMSEKMLRRAASAKENGEANIFHPSQGMDEIYDSAVTGIRELGKAVADAQIRSIETLRAHARDAAQKPASGDGAPHKAA
ncbi:MAG TPA: hypothetical protein VMD53_14165 [Rhizomicrobium sp.]|nr:hypothetical protein [Rhizomicrobium sp.]